ncbi:hypothetical protein C8R45DRAFT_1104886 [Mycena sanguinolenta]|nr:hypothetical protein C8R45DRAFT_1104886 [Mycena sanguinolenta]
MIQELLHLSGSGPPNKRQLWWIPTSSTCKLPQFYPQLIDNVVLIQGLTKKAPRVSKDEEALHEACAARDMAQSHHLAYVDRCARQDVAWAAGWEENLHPLRRAAEMILYATKLLVTIVVYIISECNDTFLKQHLGHLKHVWFKYELDRQVEEVFRPSTERRTENMVEMKTIVTWHCHVSDPEYPIAVLVGKKNLEAWLIVVNKVHLCLPARR